MKKDFVYVGIQVVLFGLYMWDVEFFSWSIPSELPSWVFLVWACLGGLIVMLALLQLNKDLSPFPSPKQGSSLIQNGVYSWIRHPIYTGLLLAFFSYGLFRESESKIIVTVFLLVLFHFKSRYEESLLIDRFGKQYESYMKTSGRFLPCVSWS